MIMLRQNKSLDDDWKSVTELGAEFESLDVRVRQTELNKMYGWAMVADSEVSGLGLVRRNGWELEVYKVFLLKQKSNAAHTELDDAAVAKLMMKLHKEKYNLADLRFWWHSHCDFDCFWSHTDHETARTLLKQNNNYMLSMVINKKQNYNIRLDLANPPITIQNIPTEFQDLKLNLEKSKKEVQSNVEVQYARPESGISASVRITQSIMDRFTDFRHFGRWGNW